METLAGLLLLYRRTATLGVLMGTAVLLNVAVLNLSYDIPVKIYSIQLVTCCLFLLANEMDRIMCFFVYNRPAAACTVYHYRFPKRWMRIGRVVLKLVFIGVAVGAVIRECIPWYQENNAQTKNMPFKAGMYDVTHYAVNGDTIPPLITDSLRWQNIVFDTKSSGSIGTGDTAFRKIYKRAYFQYKIDPVAHTFQILKSRFDSVGVASLRYRFENDSTIFFWGKRKNDSLAFVLTRSPRHFQLAEKQFHWLSEYNR